LADLEKLHAQMSNVIEVMNQRIKDDFKPEKHIGFVWAIAWVAHRLDFIDVRERALQIMADARKKKEG